MRKAVKNNLLEIFKTIYEAHEIVKGFIDRKEYENAQNLLADCQDTAIQIGNLIEESEGEGFITVSFLEEYCETLYEVATNLSDETNGHKVQKQLDKKIIKAENSAKNDIKVKLEVVFFPYKASMWDSLESVWKAADEDPECDAYVVPIPYYDRKPGGAFGEFHYEGGEYPDYVPVVHYEAYNLEQRCPDVIYVHNPYDGNNYVTSVDPRYYSFILKQYTECLVYVPYYSTSGGMSEMQRFIPSYNFFDYIVIQSKKHREYFEKSLPDSKFLAMGSPKFDRTINMCKNPPEAPAEWKKLMEGKKVYFYNTSLNGMLADTEAFMKKMKYVFETFSKHKDACILWRPHPLFESTIDSMRPQYKNVFNSLKNYFIDNKLGIYDDTPDITESIALSDAYIGDAGSSVTSLFGIAGKPLFILNNRIHTEPTDDDKIAQNIVSFNNEWLITPTGNRLFHAENKDYKFKYFCTLSDSEATTYFIPLNINGKTYVFPKDTGDILIFNGKEIIKRIPVDKNTELSNAFANQVLCDKYIYMIPYMYHAIVRFNIETEKIEYLSENIDVIVGMKDEQQYVGGLREYNGKIYICSPVDNRILIINGATGEERVVSLDTKSYNGGNAISSDQNLLWITPMFGKTVVSWNIETNEVIEYTNMPEGLASYHHIHKYEIDERPFTAAYAKDDYVFIPPCLGNMFVRINKNTGKIEKWKPPFEMMYEPLNGYYSVYAKFWFYTLTTDLEPICRLYSAQDRKLYDVNLDENSCHEIKIELDLNEIEKFVSGFEIASERLQYCCRENVFNSLSDFITDNITGNKFEKEKQLDSYRAISADFDGNCGKNVHNFICKKIR